MADDGWLDDDPIQTASAAERIVERLTARILDGTLAPGDRLPPERELAVKLQASRATVSQAMRVLAALGLVEIRHGSGVEVRPRPEQLLRHSLDLFVGLDRPVMRQLLETRGWVEIPAAGTAALRRTPSDLKAMEEALESMTKESSSALAWLEHDAAFHHAVMGATGNRFVTMLLTPTLELMTSAQDEAMSSGVVDDSWFAHDLEKSNDLHRQLFFAIRDGDELAARDAAIAHQRRIAAHMIGLVDDDSLGVPPR